MERRLQSWEPSIGGLDRDRMLFEAGRGAAGGAASERMRRRLYQVALAVALLLSCGLGLAWHVERSGRKQLELAFHEVKQRLDERTTTTESLLALRDEARHRLDSSSYLVLVHRLVSGGDADQILRGPESENAPPPRSVPATIPRTLGPRDLNRVIPL
jgi:hypothetical protein